MTEEHPKNPIGEPRSWNPIVGAFIIMTLLFLGTLAGFAWVVTNVGDLAKENDNRITDIQTSRLESCISTYEGIREVFKPFFPPPPRTKQQQADLDKFNKTINDLKLKCRKQVKPKNEEVKK